MSSDLGGIMNTEIKAIISALQEVVTTINSLGVHIVKEKGSANFVTDVDVKVNTELSKALQEIEDIPCIAEEINSSAPVNTYWVVDPIDGTTNMIHSYPSYCISIAKVIDGETTLGVVYNVPADELFIAVKGEGAILTSLWNDKEEAITVSSTEYVSGSMMATGWPYNKLRLQYVMKLLQELLLKCHDVKRHGPASLDICYIAAGRLDGYIELDLYEWDYKAAKLILEEAGGCLTSISGDKLLRGKKDVVATNGKIHTEVLQLVKQIR